jgi:vacuolar-type H+-ATPase subunit E/Vma4
MSVQEIIDKIKTKGEEERKEIQKRYENRVQEIKNKQEEERKRFYDTELEKIQNEEEEIKRGIMLSAKLEKRKKVLQFRKDQIQQVFDKVRENFRDILGKDQYYQFLKEKASQLAKEGDTVYLAPQDVKDFGAALKKDVSAKIDVKEGKLKGGLIIEKKHFNYNLSVNALIEEKREELEKEVGKKINVL